MELRPLDLGEIFDRAVTLYARNFAPLIGIATVAVVPLAVLQYPLAGMEQPRLDAMIRLLEQPELGRSQPLAPATSPPELALAIAVTLLAYLGWSFTLGALGEAVARVYAGGRIEFGACWRAALQRWLSITELFGLALAGLIAWDFAAIAVIVFAIFLLVQFAIGWLALAVPLAVVLVIAVTLLPATLLIVAGAFGFFGVVAERRGAVDALRAGFVRGWGRAQWRRSLICSIAVGAIVTGSSGALGLFALLGLSRWAALYVMLDALVRILVVPLVGLVLALYYFDIRVRDEGLDIEASLERSDDGATGTSDAGYAPTAYLSGEERALVARFLERRAAFAPPRRYALAARLAAPVRARVPADLARLDDESLLERL